MAQTPVLTNTIREKLLRDEIAYTLSIKLIRSVEIPMMAKTAGFDGILIDMEHSSFDLDTTGQLCIAALYAGIAPIVRAPSKVSSTYNIAIGASPYAELINL